MSDTEKMNEAMYERLGEIVKFASNKRVELDPDFKGNKSDEAHNRLMLGAFRELRQMVEFYKPEEKEPIVPGCPSLMPRQLPGGFGGVEAAEKEANGQDARSTGKAKLEKSYLSMRGRLEKITDLALAADAKCGTCDKVGQNWMTCSKAIAEIRKLVRESVADAAPDYEMLALQFARNSFDFAKFQEALAAVASMKAEDFPGVYYTPGWLCELAKKLDPTCGTGVSPVHAGGAADGANGQDARSTKMDPLTPEEQSDIDRALAREKRIIHWKLYPTKIDICAMGKTKQNGKVYEVRIVKRGESKVQDTYGQGKVNGKTVITCSFTGSAWMLKRILTSGMQALVNHKAKRNRDSRRNFAKRKAKWAAAKAAADNGGQA